LQFVKCRLCWELETGDFVTLFSWNESKSAKSSGDGFRAKQAPCTCVTMFYAHVYRFVYVFITSSDHVNMILRGSPPSLCNLGCSAGGGSLQFVNLVLSSQITSAVAFVACVMCNVYTC
jgi:hypothetical protein